MCQVKSSRNSPGYRHSVIPTSQTDKQRTETTLSWSHRTEIGTQIVCAQNQPACFQVTYRNTLVATVRVADALYPLLGHHVFAACSEPVPQVEAGSRKEARGPLLNTSDGESLGDDSSPPRPALEEHTQLSMVEEED